jgi:hypothetical protein
MRRSMRRSIGRQGAAACSAVKATRFAGDPNKFGSALTASARCRKWLAVIDGPLCRLRLPLATGRGHKVRHLLSIRAPSVKPSFVCGGQRATTSPVGGVAVGRADQAGGARPDRSGSHFARSMSTELGCCRVRHY